MPAYYLEALTVFLGLVLLMVEAFGPRDSKKSVGILAVVGLILILIATFFAYGPEAKPDSAWAKWSLWNFYNFDGLARFYKGFALVCTILVVLMSLDYRSILARFTDDPESENGTGEYYALPVFACAGMMWMASAKDLAGAFVALELVTITFYILVAYLRRNVGSLEAGVKYLILGALSTGFLVYGIAWIYGATGTMNLAEIGQSLSLVTFEGNVGTHAIPSATAGLADGAVVSLDTTSLLFGIALVLIALGFKVGAVPMQAWIPDVYQGAPTPTTAFLSVGSKAAGFILLIRFLNPLLQAGSPVAPQVLSMLGLIAGATLIFGNLAAIGQSNFKRLLAYSSIAHAGFLILALAVWKPANESGLGSVQTVSFYLATYLLMTLASFFVVAQVRIQDGSEEIAALNGLSKRNPILATALTLIMAALAGVPLTAGFMGKFFVFSLAVEAKLWWGLALAVVGAAAGFYYYFKVIRAIWWEAPAASATPISLPPVTRGSLVILTLAIVVLGVWPQPILWLLN
ncbi:MAG: NADH-quinone oxidoreductase subunit N [Verrucomicrobia bacterium]|nr:MAG: NADH-quinone oxidoreductase subunit N [Verrucomicrobiota bacterium]TAE89179.1 MAG: NADH-quinone oxidoreductase subunit N [Verrucomicrobiota bacterium]TAF27945.1 MAG: NADH-quinone oxidoreductase subunit N [Verrucomicrobiota bacterium]TAF42794.1 MAG: NADH-quinone oxidoreductase subunit N [Verrucomicrobiota bacterium]